MSEKTDKVDAEIINEMLESLRFLREKKYKKPSEVYYLLIEICDRMATLESKLYNGFSDVNIIKPNNSICPNCDFEPGINISTPDTSENTEAYRCEMCETEWEIKIIKRIKTMEPLTNSQFHTVWTAAVGLDGYDKKLFQELFKKLKHEKLLIK